MVIKKKTIGIKIPMVFFFSDDLNNENFNFFLYFFSLFTTSTVHNRVQMCQQQPYRLLFL